MSDSSSLIREQQSKRYTQDEEYYDVEEVQMSRSTKITLYFIGMGIGLLTLYLFVFFLPNYFIPESTHLHGIEKVSSLDVALKPLSQKRVRELGLGLGDAPGMKTDHFEKENANANDKDDDEDEDENSDLDEDFWAITENGSSRQIERLVLIGDLHGHYIEFRKLLRKIRYNPKHDHVLLLGDFISKGPDSLKVLDYSLKNNIDCILGNHEYYILQNYAQFHGLRSPFFVNNNESEVFAREKFNDDPEYLLAKRLEPKHVKFINKCSVIKKMGKVPLHKWKNTGTSKSAEGVAVHGGLRWDLSLDDQSPIENLEMRSLVGPYFNRTTEDPHEENAVSWSKIYNQKQKLMNIDVTKVVYYGHDARRGLNLKKFTKGIDTGCDRGENLTAMILWNEIGTNKKHNKIHFKEQLVQISC